MFFIINYLVVIFLYVMDNLTIIACVSIVCAVLCVVIGASIASIGEAGIANRAMDTLSQQPDKSDDIQKTLFMSMAMVESSAIYCLVIAMILIFANPFWNTLINK